MKRNYFFADLISAWWLSPANWCRKAHCRWWIWKIRRLTLTFSFSGNLRNHVFTHTNERPYKCDLCGKGFNQMSNLVCHKVKAHAHADKMQYSCGVCGKEFPRRFALRSHEEYKHGVKYRSTGNAQSAAAANESNVAKRYAEEADVGSID